MFARFDENPAMTLQDIIKTKRYGRTDGQTDGRTHGRTHTRTDNVKTVYPTTNKVCGGYKYRVNILKPWLNSALEYSEGPFLESKS